MSADVSYGELPSDPEDCNIGISVTIGTKGENGEEIFNFSVVTPKYLAHEPITQWGRGLLIVKEFSWSTIEHALQKLLMRVHRNTWTETATELNKELNWEFDNYQEYK